MATVNYLAVGGTTIVAQCEGIDSNTCAVTVSAASGLYPNKPSDCVRFAESSLTGPTAGTGAFGSWSDSNDYGTSGVGWGTDAADPISPPGVRTDRLYQGMQAGYGSGATLSGWSSPAVYYRKVYAYWSFKLVEAAYYAGGVYPGTKIGFLCYGNDVLGSGNSGVIGFRHDTGQQSMTSAQIWLLQQNNVIRTLTAGNSTGHGETVISGPGLGTPFIMGQMNELEHVAVLNSANGVADGVYQQWINRTMTHDYRDVVWRTTGGPNAFGRFRPCNLTWGGTGSVTKPSNENFRVGHCYLAGIPV